MKKIIFILLLSSTFTFASNQWPRATVTANSCTDFYCLTQQVKNWDKSGAIVLLRIDEKMRQVTILCPKEMVDKIKNLCIKNTYCVKFKSYLRKEVIDLARFYEKQKRLHIINICEEQRKICFCSSEVEVFKTILAVACPSDVEPPEEPPIENPEPIDEGPIELGISDDPGVWIVGENTLSDYRITCELMRLSDQGRLSFRIEATLEGNNRYWIYTQETHLIDWIKEVNRNAICRTDYFIECTESDAELVASLLADYQSKKDVRTWSKISGTLFSYYGAGYVKNEIEEGLK